MSLFLDVQYLNEISYRFERFTRKGDYLFNLRCPICGDSARSKHKARGYFFQGKYGLNFKCHNCSASRSFASMLQEVDPIVYKRYTVDKFKESQPIQTQPAKRENKSVLEDFPFLVPVSSLDNSHDAVNYLQARMIKRLELFYFVEKTSHLNALSEKYTNKFSGDEPRIVIPFFSQDKKVLVGVHARDITGLAKTRYFSLHLDERFPMIFGVERFHKGVQSYVVEGPFDSTFLPNCLAVGSSSLYRAEPFVNKEHTTLVYDNQPRNKEIMREVHRGIAAGFKVCIWPDNVEQKDINDMVRDLVPMKEIMETINDNTFSGPEAEFRLTKWRKC